MAAFQLPILPERFVSLGGGKRVHAQLVESGLPGPQAAASVELLTSGGARSTIAWYRALPFSPPALGPASTVPPLYEIGRPSCREGGCQYWVNAGVAGSIKQKNK